MAEDSWGYTWWSGITGPRALIERLAQALCEGRPAVLLIPETCPWRGEMRSFSAEVISGHYGLERLSIDPMTPGTNGQSPFQILLDRYALHDIALRYRESMNPQGFLVEQQVLKNRIVWLEEVPEKDLRAWLLFMSAWKPRSQSDGLFVCELPRSAKGALSGIALDNIELIDYDELVSDYSISLFNGMLVDDRAAQETTNLEQHYLASILTNLCGRDVEVSEALSNDLAALYIDPLSTLTATSRYFEPKRGADDEAHVLSLVRANNRDALERRIWSAQVEVLFPLVETLRLNVIETLRPQLEELVVTGSIMQYGERVESVADVELGTLVFLMACVDKHGNRLLYVPNPALRDEIHLLRACRNALAHIDVCPPDQMRQLLTLAQKIKE